VSQRKIDWTLTQGAFDRLLHALHADRTIAAERYEHLRTALVKFFEWRGGRAPEEYADEVLDRVSRKLHDGEAIVDVRRYCYGVARKLLLERSREEAREPLEADSLVAAVPEESDHDDVRFDCLERCLNRLSNAERHLIVEYHRERGLSKIRARKSLAAALNLAQGTLRIQAHRIRLKLERCVTECVERNGAVKHSTPVSHTNKG
jgi:DNA-directed RNA polymerase specialized sigma24 family protein